MIFSDIKLLGWCPENQRFEVFTEEQAKKILDKEPDRKFSYYTEDDSFLSIEYPQCSC